MLHLLKLEIKKLKRKHMVISLLGIVGFYAGCIYYSTDAQLKFSNTSASILFNAGVYSIFIMPILITVLSTTLIDLEQSHGMEDELTIYLSPNKIFLAKWLFTSIVVALCTLIQCLFYLALSRMVFGAAGLAISDIAWAFVSSYAVSALLITLIQLVMFKTQSQFMSVIFGLTLALVGLFGMILTPVIAHLIPSSYYLFLSAATIMMDETGSHIVMLDKPYIVFIGVCCVTAILFFASKHFYTTQER